MDGQHDAGTGVADAEGGQAQQGRCREVEAPGPLGAYRLVQGVLAPVGRDGAQVQLLPREVHALRHDLHRVTGLQGAEPGPEGRVPA